MLPPARQQPTAARRQIVDHAWRANRDKAW